MEVTASEYPALYELPAHGGMVSTHDQLLLRVWNVAHSGDAGPMRTIVRRLHRKLDDGGTTPVTS